VTIILFTTTGPCSLAEQLSHQGHQVFEAIAISEVYALADQHPRAQIIITADIDPERAKAVQHHYPTLHLKADATVRDIVWELSQFMKDGAVQ
jgi:hypothetical protein